MNLQDLRIVLLNVNNKLLYTPISTHDNKLLKSSISTRQRSFKFTYSILFMVKELFEYYTFRICLLQLKSRIYQKI